MFSILKFIRSVIALRQVIYTEAMVSGHPVSSCLWAAFRESCQRSRISLKPCRGWRDPRFSINDIVLNNCQMNTIRCIPNKVKKPTQVEKAYRGMEKAVVKLNSSFHWKSCCSSKTFKKIWSRFSEYLPQAWTDGHFTWIAVRLRTPRFLRQSY